jgi:hypothetical protein
MRASALCTGAMLCLHQTLLNCQVALIRSEIEGKNALSWLLPLELVVQFPDAFSPNLVSVLGAEQF